MVSSEALHSLAPLRMPCELPSTPIPKAPKINSVHIYVKQPFTVKTVNCETAGTVTAK